MLISTIAPHLLMLGIVLWHVLLALPHTSIGLLLDYYATLITPVICLIGSIRFLWEHFLKDRRSAAQVPES